MLPMCPFLRLLHVAIAASALTNATHVVAALTLFKLFSFSSVCVAEVRIGYPGFSHPRR